MVQISTGSKQGMGSILKCLNSGLFLKDEVKWFYFVSYLSKKVTHVPVNRSFSLAVKSDVGVHFAKLLSLKGRKRK